MGGSTRAQSSGVNWGPSGFPPQAVFLWCSSPRRETISSGEGFRGAHEAVVSDDPSGQHNPMASQGPLDGRVSVVGGRATLNREVLERVIPSGITYSWELQLRWRIRRPHGADVDGTQAPGCRRRSPLTVHLKPYWGKPTVRNFRGGRGNPKLDRARRAPLPYSAVHHSCPKRCTDTGLRADLLNGGDVPRGHLPVEINLRPVQLDPDQRRVDLARAGDVPLRGQRPGLVRRNIGLGRETQPAQEDVVEVLFNLGLVQLLQAPLFQVFRPFPEDGMGLLAAVGVDLFVSCDLLNQVGQEERANVGRQRSSRCARYEVLETGKQARRRGLFGRRFLGHAEPLPSRVERHE